MRGSRLLLLVALAVGCTADQDGDGYKGDEDCDDGAPGVHLGADEVCDGVDNDCDGVVDEDDAIDAPTWYADGDGDGFGDPDESAAACDQPAGYTHDDTDCDDGDAQVSPSQAERCDEKDNDCNGTVDDDALDEEEWYLDLDGDGYGDATESVEACEAPPDHVSEAGDCDDTDWRVYPGAPEDCDGIDNDCDHVVDEGCVEDCDNLMDDDGDGLVDCQDEDCRDEPHCQDEDCTNGRDDDADGLVDCEDGDCAGHATCVEDCENLTDDDGDGLRDCRDDDCWGEPHCLGERRAWVQSGSMATRFLTHYGTYYNSCDGYGLAWAGMQLAGAASGVRGILEVQPHSRATWSATGAEAPIQCNWSYTFGYFSWSFMRSRTFSATTTTSSTYSLPVERSGFRMSGGCPVSTSGFLPERLIPFISGSTFTSSNPPLWFFTGSQTGWWLPGTPTSYRTTSGTYSGSSSCWTVNQPYWFALWDIGSLSTGSMYYSD